MAKVFSRPCRIELVTSGETAHVSIDGLRRFEVFSKRNGGQVLVWFVMDLETGQLDTCYTKREACLFAIGEALK